MMVLPIALISFLPFSAELRAESSNTAYIIQQSKKTVTGVVVDMAGLPLIGVNVSIKGTTEGTITDLDGKFNLNVSSQSMLVISYIGYKTVEIPVRENVRVVLEEDSQALEEVVVVGYGTMRKSDVTGSIGVAKGEDLTKNQNFSALENLRGKVSGVNIFSNSSQPGAYANRVVIRGMATINSSSEPLYIVDGVAMEDFSLVNPNDIESMEVFKGCLCGGYLWRSWCEWCYHGNNKTRSERT